MRRLRRYIAVGLLLAAPCVSTFSTAMAEKSPPPDSGFIDSRSCAYSSFLKGTRAEYAH